MKKVRRLLSCAAAVCLLGSAAQALEPALDPLPDLSAYPTRLLVNGRAVEEGALPRYLEGDVLLPLRNILEQAGYAVDWDARARGAVFSAEGSGEYLLDPPPGGRTREGARLGTDPPAGVLVGGVCAGAGEGGLDAERSTTLDRPRGGGAGRSYLCVG